MQKIIKEEFEFLSFDFWFWYEKFLHFFWFHFSKRHFDFYFCAGIVEYADENVSAHWPYSKGVGSHHNEQYILRNRISRNVDGLVERFWPNQIFKVIMPFIFLIYFFFFSNLVLYFENFYFSIRFSPGNLHFQRIFV